MWLVHQFKLPIRMSSPPRSAERAEREKRSLVVELSCLSCQCTSHYSMDKMVKWGSLDTVDGWATSRLEWPVNGQLVNHLLLTCESEWTKVTLITRITRAQLHSPNESRGQEWRGRKASEWVNLSGGDTSDGHNKSLLNWINRKQSQATFRCCKCVGGSG